MASLKDPKITKTSIKGNREHGDQCADVDIPTDGNGRTNTIALKETWGKTWTLI